MNLLKKLTIGLIVVLGGGINCIAQGPGTLSPTPPATTDPIVEMLDSLVMLNTVLRLDEQVTGKTSNSDIPRYSDEIYRQRLSQISSPITLTYNEEVQRYIELYAYKKRELTSRVLGLSNLYFPLFEEILDKEGLPLEFKYLSVVESALNPVAVSRMGATGLWQFMYNTGKMYDLKVTSFYDERRDPIKSTHAACAYFKDMYAIYGDWLLVIAAYNCGAGNVNKAIRRSGGKRDFWEIAPYLPAETRGYVPAFIAVTYVMNHATEHSIFPVAPSFNYFEVDTVDVNQGIAFSKIASAIELPVDVLTFLNPVYKRGVIPQTGEGHYLRLPVSKISSWIAAEPSLFEPVIPAPLIAANGEEQVQTTGQADITNGEYKTETRKVKKTHTVRSGENLSVLAERFNCTVANLRSWNKLRSTRLNKGQKLSYYKSVKVKVPVASTASAEAKNTGTVAVKNNKTAPANADFVYHMVEKGDTIWNIAKRYEGATVDQIMKINSITSTTNLKPGTKLKVKVKA